MHGCDLCEQLPLPFTLQALKQEGRIRNLAAGGCAAGRGDVARLQGSDGELGVARAVLGPLIDVGAAHYYVLVIHNHHLGVHLRA